MSTDSPVLVWFRDDHRVGDNPALSAAAASGSRVLCFYVFDEASEGVRPLGGAARWWLHGSLEALNEALQRLGSSLVLFRGPATSVVERIVAGTGASAIYWNRRYGAAEIAIDRTLKQRLAARGIKAQSFNGRLVHEPWEIVNRAGKPFQVFTPYLRAAFARPAAPPLPSPERLAGGAWPASLLAEAVALPDLSLEPAFPDWAVGLRKAWRRGEPAARERLARFLDEGLKGYAERRDRPHLEGTSRLSPHLRFGEVSPRQVWHAVLGAAARDPSLEQDAKKYLSEIAWRDFTHQLLHDHPHLPERPHSSRFEAFPWIEDRQALRAWQKGLTGYPIVDAGMRQLWQTGWMHNRVRMIAGSFLVKHLLADWRRGEAWFWDTLVDADAANNAFSWQWIAGSGPDSAPFHRIFNPVVQGEKFDPGGDYIRAYVPELAGLPPAFIHKPWEAPPAMLRQAGIRLGETYPEPLVPHGPARERALDAFRSLRRLDPESRMPSASLS
ncbi:cryptochrome/photolyase family protein [Microvirga arsenatis]|uniref:Deoxyribodipyrimidine photo-lyase n=1 Tax=Microvirga arsenatis TaxID=2692265 RepID=A0ABW9YS82_9HYPH|nr:deoxyribodipyrimidine photo-lyase [Microvirga arsenatis]NBJ10099.1 deoxyribodipyrimidine photo-lyase [Microvirga arsenatis]NBJ23167.1 deoxyribodipyrimidine photo-lyase [Microvirga arsenatis]